MTGEFELHWNKTFIIERLGEAPIIGIERSHRGTQMMYMPCSPLETVSGRKLEPDEILEFFKMGIEERIDYNPSIRIHVVSEELYDQLQYALSVEKQAEIQDELMELKGGILPSNLKSWLAQDLRKFAHLVSGKTVEILELHNLCSVKDIVCYRATFDGFCRQHMTASDVAALGRACLAPIGLSFAYLDQNWQLRNRIEKYFL